MDTSNAHYDTISLSLHITFGGMFCLRAPTLGGDGVVFARYGAHQNFLAIASFSRRYFLTK
jgi:hypothetical protein